MSVTQTKLPVGRKKMKSDKAKNALILKQLFSRKQSLAINKKKSRLTCNSFGFESRTKKGKVQKWFYLEIFHLKIIKNLNYLKIEGH